MILKDIETQKREQYVKQANIIYKTTRKQLKMATLST